MDNNPQHRNVGNLGDILKHAALINLAQLLIGSRSSRFAYIETHAFMLEAQCPNPEQWLQETRAELTKYASYNDYFNAEKKVLENLPYQCSAGLVINELKKANTIGAVIILAEKDSRTRDILKDQLLREQLTNYSVLEDALTLSSIKLPGDVRTLLILVDPFVLDAELWNGIVTALNGIIRRGIDVVLELFTFDKEQITVPWPTSPVGMVGPVSVMHRQPYHLAVYATGNLKQDICQLCLGLGWSTNSEQSLDIEEISNNDMTDSQRLIQWFWQKFKNADRRDKLYDDGLCQCISEKFIRKYDQVRAIRSSKMRAFLLLSVFIDQIMFTHFPLIYQDFRSYFWLPKLHSHNGGGMAGPGWFIYSFHGYDKKMNWESAYPVANALLGDLFKWLKECPDGEELTQKFRTLMEIEVNTEFEAESAKKLLDIITQPGIFNEI